MKRILCTLMVLFALVGSAWGAQYVGQFAGSNYGTWIIHVDGVQMFGVTWSQRYETADYGYCAVGVDDSFILYTEFYAIRVMGQINEDGTIDGEWYDLQSHDSGPFFGALDDAEAIAQYEGDYTFTYTGSSSGTIEGSINLSGRVLPPGEGAVSGDGFAIAIAEDDTSIAGLFDGDTFEGVWHYYQTDLKGIVDGTRATDDPAPAASGDDGGGGGCFIGSVGW